MKITNIKKLSREDLVDAPPGEYLDQIVSVFNQGIEQLTSALTNSLTFKDNTNSTHATFTMTDGVELQIKNPLKVRPVGIVPMRVIEKNSGTRQVLTDFDWHFVNDQIAIKSTFKTASTTADVVLLFVGG